MNCFEVRNEFVAFWQKTLAADRRAQLLTHLRRCATCDRSFRIFALTAPVLYSAAEPEWNSGFARPTVLNPGAFELPTASAVVEYRPVVRRLNRAVPAFVMAAAAAIALYFAVPPPLTFEDAIAADNTNAQIANYPSTDSFFGQELMAQSTPVPDPVDE